MTSISIRLAVFGLLLGVAPIIRPALAQDFDLPGLDAESGGFVNTLSKSFPAGGTRATRDQAEARAAAAALEARLGQGDANAGLWLGLARAGQAFGQVVARVRTEVYAAHVGIRTSLGETMRELSVTWSQ